MKTFSLTCRFDRGYIAEPYWPEMYQVIQITKLSGMSRAKSTANARKALEEHLRQNGMTLDDFEALKARAQRPFHTSADGEIVLPPDQIGAFLVATTMQLRAASRPCDPREVRVRIAPSAWRTGKHAPDGIYRRFATVTAGTGAKLSNQRGLRESSYIEKFDARGTLTIDEQFVRPETLRQAVEHGGQFVGIGAARKMGWGRFTLIDWREEAQAQALAA